MQAEVRKGIDNNTNKTVALKIIDKSKLRRRTLEALEREVEIMKVIRHENILRLKAVAMDTTIENKNVAVLVLEIAEGGELFEYLMHTSFFDDALARTYFRQMINALKCCHDQNIFHRDIKPENILLSSNFDLKLADFGLGNAVSDETDLLYTECGTRSYMAPEIISKSDGYLGGPADIWSAGVVLFIMLCGSPPFDVAARTDWWFNACSLARYDRFWAAHLRGAGHMTNNLAAQDLLNRIFVPNPKRRITLDDILQHEWMTGPTLDETELKEAMYERQLKIKEIRARERAVMQRQAGVKRGLGSEVGERKSVDVFKRDTHRSVTKVLPQYDSSLFTPVYGGATSAAYQFLAEGADDILQRLTKHVLAIDTNAKVVADSDNYSIEAALTLPRESIDLDNTGDLLPFPERNVTLIIRVFQAPVEEGEEHIDDDLLLVTVNRKSGAVTDFQGCFQTLRNAVLDEAETSIGSGGDKKENVEEEELCEELGMI